MSPSWRDQIRISLSPSHVALMRFCKGMKPRLTAKTVAACPAGAGDAPWSGALTALDGLLIKPEWQRADASVVVSNSFARFQLLPWNEHIAGEEEQRSFARHKLAAVYGDSSEWEIRIAEGNAGTENLACGMHVKLLGSITACCSKHGVRLRSLQPYLMAAYNRVRPELAQGSIWFAVTEPERVCIMRLENGAWRSIHCRSLATDNPLSALVTVIEREQQLAGLDGQTDTTVLYAPGVTPASLASITHKKFKLVGFSSGSSLDLRTDAPFAMAAST
ncbi:hypothetical protein SCT_1860 [Sulfuricella sp. T08]|uniref:hypothetical protein n=1 Tax=Sulfuricella sp. T08 TaxID=1632857 RepID=UPI0006179CDE|nr:hypothetical protein [Sulfuricella sp. T08]GAO36453.1 hypothetical protein SCT_1860 [Sulfuricella sp. T08]